MKLIAPSILSADFSHLADEIVAVEIAGANWIHVDVMDGHFVPNITIGPQVVSSLRAVTKLPLDVHLMIENPERFVSDFADAGADIITLHVEATNNIRGVITAIKDLGIKAGISLNPATNLSQVASILPEIDLLLIMSVNPGFGGQKFIESSIAKIEQAHSMRASIGANFLIEVDGGATVTNVASISKAGADVIVAGSAIFASQDYKATICAMKDNMR